MPNAVALLKPTIIVKVTYSMCLHWVSLEVNQHKPTINMHFARWGIAGTRDRENFIQFVAIDDFTTSLNDSASPPTV